MRHKVSLFLAALLFLVVACKSGQRQPAAPTIDPALANLSKEEIYARAEKFYGNRKWSRARTYYSHLYENYPNDPLGRRSLLRVADTHFEMGDTVNLIDAQYKYRDFINRYPGSESADYAMMQIANVSYKQIGRPDRDQAKTFEAAEKLKEMIAAFPNSPLRPEADEKLKKVYDRIAKHDHLVARFYMRRKSWDSAVLRLNQIVERFPDYQDRDATFYDLGVALDALGRNGEARLYYERVVAEFPQSDVAGRARQRLGQNKT